ncbi:MAG: sigma-54-dependent Fis family transcriptional regulator [Rhizobiales bacterium]|nr:sigma-54-dependent Fis family transcriptional regulator [Hyphomicrobiales bacterium]
MENGKILFIDDEAHIRNSIAQSFDLAGLEYECFEKPNDMLSKITKDFNGIIVSDIRMLPMDGMELLEYNQNIDPEIPVILITGHADIALAVDALRKGAYDFFEKPYNNNKLINTINMALKKRSLYLEVQKLLNLNNNDLSGIIGDSTVSTNLKMQIRAIAVSNVDVLLNGATGVGKELVARTLHAQSDRAKAPFVAINCGALPLSIIESELFGHEKGSFTGATNQRIGKFEYAKGGTVFLDEIESMPLDLQVKLLRILQERNLERLGSNKLINLDIRIIAATKKNLLEESKLGNFREDLYYRLNVAVIDIPTLNERKQDITLLSHYFIDLAAKKHKVANIKINHKKITELTNKDWPGNVRELKNYCERIALGIDKNLFEVNIDHMLDNISLSERVKNFEKLEIINCLTTNKGDVQLCCEALGLPRKTFYDKLTRHNINRTDFK